MTIAEFLVIKEYGNNVHEVKKKLYKVNNLGIKVGFVFMLNGKRITDINHIINTGDELFLAYDFKKHIVD